MLSIVVAWAMMAGFANADLVITEVLSDSAHSGGVANGDWWELTNTGSSSVDLTGYYWDDDGPTGNDGALFGDIIIAAGESIVIVSEDDDDLFEQAWGGGFNAYGETNFTGPDTFSGLSSNGDQIQLWDADPNAGAPFNLVASVSFGPATEGFSFQWSATGAFLGLSEFGVNGAFTAIDDGSDDNTRPNDGIDVGSPGIATAIPEPGAATIAVIGFALAAVRRRR